MQHVRTNISSLKQRKLTPDASTDGRAGRPGGGEAQRSMRWRILTPLSRTRTVSKTTMSSCACVSLARGIGSLRCRPLRGVAMVLTHVIRRRSGTQHRLRRVVAAAAAEAAAVATDRGEARRVA